jgi:lysophospholipase L1-like esterase
MTNAHKRAAAVIRTLWRVWIQITIVLLMLAILEVAIDISLHFTRKPEVDPRIYADGYQTQSWTAEYYDELDAFRVQWHPYVYWIASPRHGRYINIGDDGLRPTWHGPAPSNTGSNPRVFRIFMFGGSAVWGEGARDNYTIPSLIQKLLAATPYRVEVTNFGQRGYVSTQEVLFLQEQLLHGKIPDLVIFYDGSNDVESASLNGEAGVTYDERYRGHEFNLLNWHNPHDRSLLYYEAFKSIVVNSGLGQMAQMFVQWLAPQEYRVLQGRLTRLMHRQHGLHEEAGDPHLEDDIIRDYLYNKGVVEDASRRYGFECLFYWQPVIHYKKELTPYEAAWEKDPWVRETRDLYIGVYQRMAEIHDKVGVHDMGGLFSTSSAPYFLDYVHINESGNLVVARAMLPDILDAFRKLGSRHMSTQIHSPPARIANDN